jgi:hypothetical protein
MNLHQYKNITRHSTLRFVKKKSFTFLSKSTSITKFNTHVKNGIFQCQIRGSYSSNYNYCLLWDVTLLSIVDIYTEDRCNNFLRNAGRPNCENNQQDATIQINLLFQVSSTCFGRYFRPSSGALDYIYSIW